MDIKKNIALFEKDRFSVSVFLWVLILVSVLRFVLEIHLLDPTQYNIDPFISLAALFHFISFYFAFMLIGAFILVLVTKTHPKKLVNAMLFGSFGILLGPLLDSFVFNWSKGYDYILLQNFFPGVFTFFFSADFVSWGLKIQVYLLIFLMLVYIFHKTKNVFKAVGGALLMYFSFAIASTYWLRPLIPQEASVIATQSLIIAAYLILAMVFALGLFYIANKKKLLALIESIKPVRTLYVLGVTLAGMLLYESTLAQSILLTNPLTLFSLSNAILWPPFIFAFLAILFTWWVSALLNDLYDIEIDKQTNRSRPLVQNIISKSEYWHLIHIVFVLALFTGFMAAFTLSFIPLLIVIAGTILSFVYSVPPLRIRNTMFSSVFIGILSVFALVMGYSFKGGVLTAEMINIVLVLFFTLSVGGLIKDLKDYAGDKKAGVRTLFTVLGREKGKKVASVLLFLSFLSPLLIVNALIDAVFLSAVALSSALLFWKKDNIKAVIFMAMLTILFVTARLIYV